MTRNHNLYLNICILHTDVYSQHHFINFNFQKTTKLVKMFKKIRSVSKIKKKTDKKVNITPSIENWPKYFIGFSPRVGIFSSVRNCFRKYSDLLYWNYSIIHITRDPFGFSNPFHFPKRVEAAYALLSSRYRLYPLASVAYAA